MPSRRTAAEESLRRPCQGATSMEQLSVGCHPRLIYDAAAAAKTVSDSIQARFRLSQSYSRQIFWPLT
jgi:hypothetical protein